MEKRDELRTKLDQLERRFDELQGEIRTLLEISLSLEMTVEQLVERGVISREQVARRVGFAVQLYRQESGSAVEKEFARIEECMLDAQLEAFDEEELPCA